MRMPKLALLFGLIVSLSGQSAFGQAKEDPNPGLNEDTFKGLEWRGIGPALMSGRIADIAIDPADRSTWYIAVGSGGVWKTTNRGVTWASIFDEQGSYSIGTVEVDPNHHNTVWVGTGENVSGRHVGFGDGIYKSMDGGVSWKNTGLKASEHIGMIAIDPRDSNVVYAAAQGPLWSGGGDRGLYKTTNGGENRDLILSGGAYTGINEVHLDPRDQARSIELQLLALQQTLKGNEARSLYGDAGPVPISSRLNAAVMGTFRSSYGPTATHSQAVEIAAAEFAGVASSLGRIVDVEMPALRKELDEAGVPWTPGRGVPGQD